MGRRNRHEQRGNGRRVIATVVAVTEMAAKRTVTVPLAATLGMMPASITMLQRWGLPLPNGLHLNCCSLSMMKSSRWFGMAEFQRCLATTRSGAASSGQCRGTTRKGKPERALALHLEPRVLVGRRLQLQPAVQARTMCAQPSVYSGRRNELEAPS